MMTNHRSPRYAGTQRRALAAVDVMIEYAINQWCDFTCEKFARAVRGTIVNDDDLVVRIGSGLDSGYQQIAVGHHRAHGRGL